MKRICQKEQSAVKVPHMHFFSGAADYILFIIPACKGMVKKAGMISKNIPRKSSFFDSDHSSITGTMKFSNAFSILEWRMTKWMVGALFLETMTHFPS